MSDWKLSRLLASTETSASGAWTCVLSIGVLLLIFALRARQAPEERRNRIGALVFASSAFLLSIVRLLLLPLGLRDRVLERALGVVDTICLAFAITLLLMHLLLEALPRRFERRTPPIIQEVVAMVSFVIIVVGALGDAVAKNLTSVIATSAVLTAVVGLALQSTLTNLFAGLALQMDRAFSVGDWITLGTRTGRITEIRWRSTALRTVDGDQVMVPNSKMLSDEVHNYSRPSPAHRVWVSVGFHFRHPPNAVRAMILESVRGIPGIATEPAPDCFPTSFGESSITYAVRFWINDFARGRELEGEVLTRIWYGAHRAGIEIPFPIRTVHLHTDDAAKREADSKAERTRRLTTLEDMVLFASLERNDKELLADGMRTATFASGQAIIEQGSRGTSMYIIVRGQVRVSLTHGTASRVLATLRDGDFFGEMSMLTGEARTASCWAVGDVECYVVDHEAMRRVLSASPHVADELAAVLVDRQAEMQKEEVALKSASRKERKLGLVTRIRQFFDLG